MKQIKSRRQKIGMTQAKLAIEAGVSQSMIAKIEAGVLDPAYTKAQKILETLERLEKKEELKAKDVMVRKVYSAKKESKIAEVVRIMSSKGLSQMPVVENGNIVGMVTEKTILAKMGSIDVKKSKVGIVMEEMPPIVSEDTLLSTLNVLLQNCPLVVVGKKGRFMGVVTKTDIIKNMI